MYRLQGAVWLVNHYGVYDNGAGSFREAGQPEETVLL